MITLEQLKLISNKNNLNDYLIDKALNHQTNLLYVSQSALIFLCAYYMELMPGVSFFNYEEGTVVTPTVVFKVEETN